MQYVSTRACGTTASCAKNFTDILLDGLALDGGLYLPTHYPQISERELNDWRELSYPDLAFEILRKFIGDIPDDDLRALIFKTYTARIYRHARSGDDAKDITPLKFLERTKEGGGLALLSLSNGPTLAFKDMALQLLGALFEYTLDKSGAELNILGATSGDTGSAAEYAMRARKGIRVFMLSPYQKMSPFQTAQMFSLQDENIYNLAIEGVFDDCQDIVKDVSNDLVFKTKYKIGTVNSINWARVMTQVVYYFKAYLAATDRNDQRVSFAVPSGNFGNVCAGHIARMMGLPISKLVVATNENDVLDEFFKTGVYRVRTSQETSQTSSPSMDISKASNIERFFFDLLERNGSRVKLLFQKLSTEGVIDLSGKSGSDGDEFKNIGHFGFVSGKSTHEDRLQTVREINSSYGLVIDPHTADGFKVAKKYQEPKTLMIVLETALAAKFNEMIFDALGKNASCPADFVGIESLPQKFEMLDADVQKVKDYIAHNVIINPINT